jgi:TRAP-type C4-dicarboxylate transport system permease small subunit
MRRFIDYLEKTKTIFITVLMFSLLVVVFLQIFTRFILLKPLMWTEEVARFCFIWLIFVGASINVRKRAHFALELFSSKLSPRSRIYITFLIHTLVGIFALSLLVLGWTFFKVGIIRVSPTIDISMAYVYAAIPLSGIFMLIYTIESIYKEVKRLL